ncbi:MAG: hypothetical protein NTW97_02015 [Candidatus Krumholzibacteria bacterium]|nr:hypothetical protein [Candidatus Krumholzibacteria bacterium]
MPDSISFRPLAFAILRVHVRAASDEKIGHLPVTAHGREMEQARAGLQIDRLHVGPPLQEEIGDFTIPAVHGVLQRRAAVRVLYLEKARVALRERFDLLEITLLDRLVNLSGKRVRHAHGDDQRRREQTT